MAEINDITRPNLISLELTREESEKAYNDGLSGLNSFQLAVKDEYGQVEPIIVPHLQSQIQLEAWRDGRDLDGRVYTISIIGTDHAGNSATAEAIVTVPHDRRKEANNERSSK